MKYVFSVLLLISVYSHAFTLTIPGAKGYANPEIQFEINQSSCPASVNLRQLVSDSVSLWNNVSTSKLKLSVGADSVAVTNTFPPVIYCDSTMVNYSGLGGSLFNFNGNAIQGSLSLNTNPASGGSILLQNEVLLHLLIAHEIGHVLGLGHSEVDYAVMYYSYGTQTSASLAQDDIDGITYLYPSDEQSSKMMGCGLVRGPPLPPASTYTLCLLLLMPLLLGIRLRLQK